MPQKYNQNICLLNYNTYNKIHWCTHNIYITFIHTTYVRA